MPSWTGRVEWRLCIGSAVYEIKKLGSSHTHKISIKEYQTVPPETLVFDGDHRDVSGLYSLFDQSEWADGWPEVEQGLRGYGLNENGAEIAAARQYMVILKVLHDLPFGLKEVLCFENPYHNRETTHELVCLVQELCARAEYLGCLPQISRAVLEKLFAERFFWDCVAERPWFYLQMATKLRCKNIYFDALRHMIGNSDNDNNVVELMEAFGKSEEEVMDFISPLLAEQASSVSNLRCGLRRLQLFHERAAAWGGGTNKGVTTFVNMLEFSYDRSDKAKADENAQFYARSIFGQWLAQHEVGDRVYYTATKRRMAPAGPLDYGVMRVEKYALYRDPTRLFGVKVVDQIIDRFGLSKHAGQQVYWHLRKLVQDAAKVIRDTFPVMEVERDGVAITYRRAHPGGDGKYFTYFGLNESKTPWRDLSKWDSEVMGVHYDSRPAGRAMLNAIGIPPSAINVEDEAES